MEHTKDSTQQAFQALQAALHVRRSDEWARMVLYKEFTRRVFEKEPELAMEILEKVENEKADGR